MATVMPAFIWLLGVLVALVFLVFPDLAAAQQKFNANENFNQTYPLTDKGSVAISNANGKIEIETWERNEVKVEAQKIIEDCEREIVFEIKVNARPDFVKIETEIPSQSYSTGNWNKCRKAQVDYKLTIPTNARLNEVESVNGEVKIVGVKGAVRASTVNGSLMASNLAGSAELSTVNGTLEASFDRLEPGANLKLSAVNGRVSLSIPSDSDATLKADTVNGAINNDFGLPVKKGEYVGRNLFGRIGGGNAQIDLETVNGTIEIKRNNDGKTPKQVSNLLETTVSSGRTRNTAQTMNAEIDRGVREGMREAVREAQQAVREAQREMRDAQKSNSTEARRDAERALKAAQRELDELQRDMAKTAPVAPVAPIPPVPGVLNVPSVPPVPPVAISFGEDERNSLFSERETKSLALNNSQRLNIETKDARMTVRGWDKSEVSYTVLKQAANESELKQIQVQTSTVGNEVFLKIIEPTNRGGMNWNYDTGSNVELEVFVPRNANLRITGSDGEMRVENVSGAIEVSGSDGNIDLRDVSGNLKVRTSDGRIRVIGFSGAMDAQSSDGTINLEGDFSQLSARTSDGTIVLTLKDGTNATIETNTEEVSGNFAKRLGETQTWQIGNGNGAKFNLKTDDGEIIIRRQSTVSVQP